MMALFGIKKNKTAKTEEKKPASKAVAIRDSSAKEDVFVELIIRPRITEKSGMMSESANIYTFEVKKKAAKDAIAKAVKSLYKVTPIKVRMINLPEKKINFKGKVGLRSGVKKALVYLKKGDKIEFA